MLPTGTVRLNQASGLGWFTVALKIKIGHKELTVLASRDTQLQVMLSGSGLCISYNLCVYIPGMKHSSVAFVSAL